MRVRWRDEERGSLVMEYVLLILLSVGVISVLMPVLAAELAVFTTRVAEQILEE